MNLPSSYLGFGVSTDERDRRCRMRLDPRGAFDMGFELRWNQHGLWVGMAKLNEWAMAASFDAFRRTALMQLDSFEPTQVTALNALASELTAMQEWLIDITSREISLQLSEWPEKAKGVALLKALANVAETFAPPTSSELTRLLHGARKERDIGKRRYDLRCLQERYFDRRETIDYFIDITQDDDGDVRHQAAQALLAHHTEYRKVAELTFRELALGASYPATLRAQALADYCKVCEREDQLAILSKLALGVDQTIAAIATDALDKLPGTEAIPLLLSIANSREDDLALVAVRKLARFPPFITRFENELLGKLSPPTSERLQAQIIDVLGEVGTRESLAPLVRLGRGTFFTSPLRQAARTAVERLRRRLPAAEAGALTISAQGGELSVGEDET